VPETLIAFLAVSLVVICTPVLLGARLAAESR
jgi:hypothetical protein